MCSNPHFLRGGKRGFFFYFGDSGMAGVLTLLLPFAWDLLNSFSVWVSG